MSDHRLDERQNSSLASAKARYIRMSPQKVRVVAALLRNKGVSEALAILKSCKRKAAPVLAKLLWSAINNADQKGSADLDNMYVKKLLVDDGPTFKRWLPRARGMATPILKRTCHIGVELEER